MKHVEEKQERDPSIKWFIFLRGDCFLNGTTEQSGDFGMWLFNSCTEIGRRGYMYICNTHIRTNIYH